MTKTQILLDKYLTQFTPVEVSFDNTNDGVIAYIYTERFLATSLRSDKVKFEDFEPNIKRLYQVTFGDQQAMRFYTDGKIRTIDQFTDSVLQSSNIWHNNRLFGKFIVTDKENGDVVGYERISESVDTDPDTASIGYCIGTDYQRGGKLGKQNVGYECAGGLVLKYGQEYLFHELLNPFYNTETDQFEGGTPLKKIMGSVHHYNIASAKLLHNLGFEYKDNYIQWDHYIKDYEVDGLGSLEFTVANLSLV